MEDKAASVKKGDLKETCFGKIVEGQQILDFMASHHEKNFRGMSMVGIESVKVLNPVQDLGVDPRLPQTVTENLFKSKRKDEFLAAASTLNDAVSKTAALLKQT